MGIDAEFKIRPHEPMSEESFNALRSDLHAAFPDEMRTSGHRWPDMAWHDYGYEKKPTIDVTCMDRYFSVGYPRGYWPRIAELGDWLTTRLEGVADVRYGSDMLLSWEDFYPWGTIRDTLEAHWSELPNEA